MEQEKITLKEMADLYGVSIEDAQFVVCDCDLLNAHMCPYHSNNEIKFTESEWKEMSKDGDQYGIITYDIFAKKRNIKDNSLG